jgi:hypothetical protein
MAGRYLKNQEHLLRRERVGYISKKCFVLLAEAKR